MYIVFDSFRNCLSFFIPKGEQGIVRPLAVLSVLPAVTPVFLFKGSRMPCEQGLFVRHRAQFLFPYEK